MGARSPLLKAHGDDVAWSLLDAMPDAVVIASSSGEIVFANDHAAELFGYPLEDLVGRVVEDLVPESLASVHRAHRTRYRAEPTARAMGAGLRLRARRAGGPDLPVEISLSPLRLGDEVFAIAAVRDISDRVEAQDQLQRVLRTLDASDDAVFIFDTESLRYSYVNDGAVRLVGYARDELLSMTPVDLNPHATEAEYRRLVKSLLEDPTATVTRQTVLLRKDGVEVPVEKTLHSALVDRDGNSSVISLARDITARLAAETALAESRDALQRAEREVAIGDDRERIARDLHDTVIQRLFGEGLRLQSALASADDPERTRTRIQSTIDGLDQTIRDLRTAVFSLQGGGNAPGGLRGRLLEVVTDATSALGFEPRLQFDGPVETIDDRVADQLLPVLREALSNVAHHAAATTARVAITVDGDITLTVSDDGVGVPDEVLGGRGLANMRERALDLRGECTIQTVAAGGSRLTWRVPVGS